MNPGVPDTRLNRKSFCDYEYTKENGELTQENA